MKIRVTIEVEVPDEVPGYAGGGPAAARSLLADALAEFSCSRSPAERYVEERYGGPDYAWVDKAEKIKTVKIRNEIARQMQHGFKLEIL